MDPRLARGWQQQGFSTIYETINFIPEKNGTRMVG
jgi:hypothetical protein